MMYKNRVIQQQKLLIQLIQLLQYYLQLCNYDYQLLQLSQIIFKKKVVDSQESVIRNSFKYNNTNANIKQQSKIIITNEPNLNILRATWFNHLFSGVVVVTSHLSITSCLQQFADGFKVSSELFQSVLEDSVFFFGPLVPVAFHHIHQT
ncbi:Hypothetical_protein [Hexamita inflata]|uniref:Hypothetical_protein n=1 Tax=Hexamita inflata TaxID=28002 RepID=A0ABP1JG91_9EUKA